MSTSVLAPGRHSWVGLDARSRPRESEAVRQVPPHGLPKVFLVIFRDDPQLIIVLFKLVVVSTDLRFVGAGIWSRTRSSASATATTAALGDV